MALVSITYCYEHGVYLRQDTECQICEAEMVGAIDPAYSTLESPLGEIGIRDPKNQPRSIFRAPEYKNPEFSYRWGGEYKTWKSKK